MGVGAACLIVGLGIGLGGCAAAPAAAPATPSASETAPADPAPTEARVPEFDPAGTAAENLAYFDSVVAATIAVEANPPGRTIVDALVAAGFAKEDLEVTADETTKGEPADSIQFSARVNGECLVGQNGPSSGGYHSVVAPLLATGTCLVGATRQIDW
jgi:pectin methylesterase-like acyl-CoA thioesterase